MKNSTVMDRPIESETTKIVENSYRATILAFLNEWSIFSERNGVDLIKVVRPSKMRPTYSNIIFPGPGIGGYCLPEDGGLGNWAYSHLLGFEDGDSVFKISTVAIDVNDTRGLHVAELTRDALRNMGRYIAGARVLVAGASYREDVGDTRYSGSELVVRKMTEMGAEISMHDPYVDHWYELENQDTYPAPGHSWSRFFRNQQDLSGVHVQKDSRAAPRGVEVLVLAVRQTATLAASGGTPSYSWSLTNNTSLPRGLNLSTGGQITGNLIRTGMITFTVQVTDSSIPAQTATQSLDFLSIRDFFISNARGRPLNSAIN